MPKPYDKELWKRRDEIAEHLRSLEMRCFGQVDLTEPSNGATLVMECWCRDEKVVLLIVDKFGGICTYRPLTPKNEMKAELDALKEYLKENL